MVNPYGDIPWVHVTIYNQYAAPGVPDPNVWDVAVIHLAQPVGSETGWMGLHKPCQGGNATDQLGSDAAGTGVPKYEAEGENGSLDGGAGEATAAGNDTFVLITAGYPAEKPSGTCMTTECTVTQVGTGLKVVVHYCTVQRGWPAK